MKLTVAGLIVGAALAVSPAWSESDIERLSTLLAGTFDTHVLDPDLPPEQRFVDKRLRLNAPQLGDYVFYQQINQHENLQLYRQRILILSVPSGSDQIQQQAFSLRDADWYVDADASVFAALRMDDLEDALAHGCAQVWTRTATGFRGYVDPQRCRIVSSRTGKTRLIESENRLTAATLSVVERGFDAETGEQLFGTPPGESVMLGRLR